MEGKSIGSSKGSSWFEEHLICRLGSKIYFVIHYVPIFIPHLKNCARIEDISWIEDVVECTPIILFMIFKIIDMVGFVNPHKLVVQKSAFSNLANVHEMKMFQT